MHITLIVGDNLHVGALREFACSIRRLLGLHFVVSFRGLDVATGLIRELDGVIKIISGILHLISIMHHTCLSSKPDVYMAIVWYNADRLSARPLGKDNGMFILPSKEFMQ